MGDGPGKRLRALAGLQMRAILPGLLAVPFAITDVFFHQVPLAIAKGWSLELLAASLIAYAIGRVGASLIAFAQFQSFKPISVGDN